VNETAKLLRSPIQKVLDDLSIARAKNDLLIAADGREYIDLLTGCGTVFLGHSNRAVTDAVHKQLDELWNTGALQTTVRSRAAQLIETFFPANYRVASLYSTGMEAAEFALRFARITTGRKGIVGFEGCMHGKSTATAFLGWPNELVSLPDSFRVPYVSTHSEERVLGILENTLAQRSVAAVFIEPLQGSSGGHLASPDFFQNLAGLCARYGTLLIVDEIFTGFHRTGNAFLLETLGIVPDVVLVGKAMGNGFPVSGVVIDRKHSVKPSMFPSSTFAGNPLAAAAIIGALSEMKALNMRAGVAWIASTIREALEPLQEVGISIRGSGALWILELPAELADETVVRIVQKGVIVAPTASYIRLLPPATISPEHLIEACGLVSEAVRQVVA
jgi:4-aminobutyrate aminotransferase-like enzyme